MKLTNKNPFKIIFSSFNVLLPPLQGEGRVGMGPLKIILAGISVLLVFFFLPAYPEAQVCQRTISADVVALDQPFFYNRLGTFNPIGMIYALRRDVVNIDTLLPESVDGILAPGQVMLRPDKRPRPIVLRMNVGDCLEINFTNLLNPAPVVVVVPGVGEVDDQPHTREASIHVNGMQLVNNIADDGSFVGRNAPGSLARPGETKRYKFYAESENAYLLYSMGSTVGAEGAGGTLAFGLFGAVNVEPRGAEWYRSQLTHEEMILAKIGTTPGGQPIINYDIRYPNQEPFITEGKANLPILRMLDPATNKIVHTNIEAVITGPNRGNFAAGTTYPSTPLNPQQEKPFREFTSVFHDEIFTLQAFQGFFLNPVLEHTLAILKDGFAINYGTGGIGAEIIANRLGVGPMWDCVDCKYEEFFLTSWAVGDPAMVVDIPANAGLEALVPGQVPPPEAVGRKATAALFPDDPSNVHHSYLNDHVKIRNVHAGPKEHHIFHLHSHQWVFSPQNDKSIYLDSQQIGVGSAYTYDIVNGGAGNRNKTPGDAIYHCHFYPHFAQGMWAHFRVHDVFEEGTVLLNETAGRAPFVLRNGRPALGARALPDGEIDAGTPIPFVVPIPNYAMAPMPAKVRINPQDFRRVTADRIDLAQGKNPGFPFYIAAIAGHRPPTPPLDLKDDGGLPRHIITGGVTVSVETRLDFHKEFDEVNGFAIAEQVPETGTREEQAAMRFHGPQPSGIPFHNTFRPDGTPATGANGFRVNGQPAVAGAPFADPCVDDAGSRVTAGSSPRFFNKEGIPAFSLSQPVQFGANNPRIYKGANLQLDMVFNKVGWHHPQQRIITLWNDVAPTLNGSRPAEPFVMRLNTLDCAEYWHTNLVPHVYEVDDFQVRTPTDIIGQHIHLVKFDVTSSDGAANGWNYEDGTMSPSEVIERIDAINRGGGLKNLRGQNVQLTAKPHPFFNVLGARTTIQRWFADPVLDNQGKDRTLGVVFTHDHFGPSSHQQIGLYGTLLVEPAGSQWRHNETGTLFGNRNDGGPTSWQAAILPPDQTESFREFYLEYSDFQHAYERNWDGRIDGDSFLSAINPSVRLAHPRAIFSIPGVCPGGVPRPCPEAIAGADVGIWVTNYRNEPVGLRVFDPQKVGTDGIRGAQTDGQAGDLSFAFSSISRRIPELNNVMASCARFESFSPAFHLTDPGDPPHNFLIGPELLCPQLTRDVGRFDPATPILRAYNNDNVKIKIQVGATEESHFMSIHGVKWLQEFANPRSGWRNSMSMGISEQFQLNMPLLEDIGQQGNRADYLWATSAASDIGLWSGTWGLMRSYDRERSDLYELPNNNVSREGQTPVITNASQFEGVCPENAPEREYDVTAIRAADALRNIPAHILPGIGPTLIYNSRPTVIPDFVAAEPGFPPVVVRGAAGPLHDPTALMYVMTEDLNPDGTLRPGAPVEPLILRANAGECVKVTLRNRLPLVVPDLDGLNAYQPIVDRQEAAARGGGVQKITFNANDVRPSSNAGLHIQLLDYNIQTDDGTNVGINPIQTVAPGGSRTYRWYAGDLRLKKTGPTTAELVATPVEFGVAGIMPSDRFEQVSKGLIGALIVLPEGAVWADNYDLFRAGTLPQGERITRDTATVEPPAPQAQFRDFVAVLQSNINMRYANNRPVETFEGQGAIGVPEDVEEAGQKAVNYKTEPLWFRLGFPPHLDLGTQREFQTAAVYSNSQPEGGTGPAIGEPQTPIFTAFAGEPVRFRFVEPGGNTRAHVIVIHGHLWDREPYNEADFDGDGIPDGPTMIMDNPTSQKVGHQEGMGPTNHFDIVPKHGAGGAFGVIGDYLYRMMTSQANVDGMWGIFRVEEEPLSAR